jgi:hypothetical protein
LLTDCFFYRIIYLIVFDLMAFFTSTDLPERESIFTCRSSFTPYVPPQEIISLQDHVPQSVKEEKKKDGDIEYLPGERLLIKLAKQRKKEKGKTPKPRLDVDRVAKSLSRVLSTF